MEGSKDAKNCQQHSINGAGLTLFVFSILPLINAI